MYKTKSIEKTSGILILITLTCTMYTCIKTAHCTLWIWPFFFFFCVCAAGDWTQALHILGKHSTSELYSLPYTYKSVKLYKFKKCVLKTFKIWKKYALVLDTCRLLFVSQILSCHSKQYSTNIYVAFTLY